jgi:glycosyltransferase involved in cell wall biosynthesis
MRGAPRIAYVYERPDTSTFRYRAWNMIEALRTAETGAGAAWFCLDDLEATDAILDRADCLVLCRTRYSAGIARLIAGARSRGLRVLFDVDDLVFDGRYAHLVLDTLDQAPSEADFDFWFGYTGRIGGALRFCDGAIVTNSYLGEKVTAFAGLPTHVVPNFLNALQLNASARILQHKRASGFRRDRHIHLGYFSGTPSHNRDFAIVSDVVADLMARDPRLRLRLVGFIEPRGRLAGMADRIDRHPLQDFVNLQRLIGEVELNLVPLQDNAFTNCKSELKVFEAAVVGTLSIASPSYTLRPAIEQGEAGWVAPAHRWREVLTQAIAALDDLPPMAEAAAAAAIARYRPEAQAAAILAAVRG